MQDRIISLRPQNADYEIRVIGGRVRPLRDFYHVMLRLNWPLTLCLVTASFLLANTLFAFLYLTLGGVANAAPGSFTDAFFFSVETMGTVGYGSMYPASQAANWCMVAESVVGLTLTALTTGLVFAKFSRPTARIVFSEKAVVCPVNGVPTLMFRIGNERGNSIVDAQMRGAVSKREITAEGEMLYRLSDLQLVRNRAVTLNRALVLSHRLEPGSALYEQTPESLITNDIELQLLVVGLDDTTMQTVHATYTYYPHDIYWGARLADVLSDAPDGGMILNLRYFHLIEPLADGVDFPYRYRPEIAKP
jgi:inward rectifier potassium channel